MRWITFALLATLVTVEGTKRARACSPPLAPELRFFRFEAPVGGVWWVHGVDTRFNTETFPLVDEAGNEVLVDIVSVGASGSAALRVPNVPVGTRFLFPDSLQRPSDSGFGEQLVVSAGGAPQRDEPPPPPEILIEDREIRVGYEGVLTSPIGGECVAAGAPGFWTIHYDEAPFLVIADPGDDVVLDVELQTPEEAPFDEVESANEILFDARIPEAIDVRVSEPPGTVDRFSVHVRVRRIDDGATSATVSLDVELDDVPAEKRLELVGCNCESASPASVLPAALVLLLVRNIGFRRRGQAAQNSPQPEAARRG